MNNESLLDRIAQASRTLRLGQKLPPDGPIPWDAVARVQADFKRMVDESGVSLANIARAMGEGYSLATMTRWRNMTSRDDDTLDVDRVTRGVNSFLETIARRAESRVVEGFVETDVARRMLIVISKTIELCSIGIIQSDAGRGKSMTLQAAADIHPGAVLLRITRSSRTPRGIAVALAGLLNIRNADRLAIAESRLIDKLRGSGRCLLIDEAHQLKPETLELLRDLHDECGVPIVLAGTARISEMVNDDQMFFAQFSSRVALWCNLNEAQMQPGDGDPKPLHTVDEIRKLYEADKVRLTDDARAFISRLSNLPGLGGLRLCSRIIQVAAAASGSRGGGLIDERLLAQVLATLHGRAVAQRCIEQASSGRRVAAG